MSRGPADPQLTAAPVSGSAPRGFGTKTSQLSCLPDQVKWCSSLLKVDWRVWLVLGKLWISSAPLLIDLSGERGKVVVRTCLDLPHGVVVQLQAGSSRADSANSGTCCCCRVGGSQATDEHGHSSSCLLTCSIQDMTMAPVWPRRGEDGERALMWNAWTCRPSCSSWWRCCWWWWWLETPPLASSTSLQNPRTRSPHGVRGWVKVWLKGFDTWLIAKVSEH